MGDLVAEGLSRSVGELVVLGLGLLDGEHVDVAALQPGLDAVDAGADGVDVPGRDAHRPSLGRGPRLPGHEHRPRHRRHGRHRPRLRPPARRARARPRARRPRPGPAGERVRRAAARRTSVGAEILVADLSDRAQRAAVADRLADAARPVDLLVNNAGFGMKHSFLGGELADEERMLDVLCRAVLVLSHAAALPMRARGHGAIVNVSSVAGFVPMGTYSAAKAWSPVHRGPRRRAGRLRRHRDGALPGVHPHRVPRPRRLDMSRLPEFLWLDADRLVRDCLDDVAPARWSACRVRSTRRWSERCRCCRAASYVAPRAPRRPCAAAAADPHRRAAA